MTDRKREYIGDARVLDVKKKKTLQPGEILVKLRREGQPPWWQLFKLEEFKTKVCFKPA